MANMACGAVDSTEVRQIFVQMLRQRFPRRLTRQTWSSKTAQLSFLVTDEIRFQFLGSLLLTHVQRELPSALSLEQVVRR